MVLKGEDDKSRQTKEACPGGRRARGRSKKTYVDRREEIARENRTE